MKLKRFWFVLVLAVAAMSVLCAAAETYYMDSNAGENSNDGTAPNRAWKTLEQVNRETFKPGDKILFKSGTRYSGQLKPSGSGAVQNGRTNWITVASYGSGKRPRIDGEGKFRDAVLLHNVEFWKVENLEITNLGETRETARTGVRVASEGFGRMRGIFLRNLDVHDVNGDLRKEHEGCGILFESFGGNDSHFDDLLIENCHVVRTDRNGICQRTAGHSRSVGVVIRGNVLEDIGGDGIKIWGSNGALVEHNVIHGGRMRSEDYAAGIWPFASDDTVIQFNEVSGMKGTKDGQGFDSDYFCRRSLFQYNYSHDNEGGFFLICSPGNAYNSDTVIRYNISQNDGIKSARVFHFGGASSNTLVYNNTIYISPKQDLPLIRCTDWSGGNAQAMRFFNNLFYVDGRVTYDWGKSRDAVFENNVFCGMHVDPPNDPAATTNCPPLVKPGNGADGFESLKDYAFQKRTKGFTGKMIPNNGGRDFFDRKLPANKPPRIGAVE